MADPYGPYRRYTTSTERAAAAPNTGYIPSGAASLSFEHWRTDLSSSSALQTDILGQRAGGGVDTRPGTSTNGYPSSWEDRYLTGRRDVAIRGTETGVSNILSDRVEPLRKSDDVPVSGRETNVLFVDALPMDCSRREVSHLFRPFVGFKEIRLIHKEPRHSTDKAMVLCFVEFADTKHAITALKALQGYKFDYKKPDSPGLRIHFAHFPFQVPTDDAHLSSQPSDNAHGARYASQPPPKSDHIPSQLPHKSAHVPSQLPPTSAHFSSQLPSSSAYFPSQAPLNSAQSSFKPPPHREEQDLTIPRVKELVVQDEEVEDEEPVVKKYKLGPSKKKEKEAINKKKKWCIKCKQNHFGDCYNFKNCYICGEPGHIGKDCTSSKPRLCYGCGEPGHIHAVCPNGPKPEKKGKKGNASETLT